MTATPAAQPGFRALVLADGDCPARSGLDTAWPGWERDIELVVAADGGARLADRLGLRLDLWVGDGDSIGAEELERLAASGVPLERAPTDKDESDTELAVLAALARGAGEITVLGGLGGLRIDHALANIALLGHPAAAGRRISLLDDRARITLLDAPGLDGQPVRVEVAGRVGDVVSLLPAGQRVAGIVTRGLRYRLDGESLDAGPARGLSNVRTSEVASISAASGRLLIVESPATFTP